MVKCQTECGFYFTSLIHVWLVHSEVSYCGCVVLEASSPSSIWNFKMAKFNLMWWMEAKKIICGGFSTKILSRTESQSELINEREKLNAGI